MMPERRHRRLQHALTMLFEAHREEDVFLKPFLLGSAERHLEFLVYMDQIAPPELVHSADIGDATGGAAR